MGSVLKTHALARAPTPKDVYNFFLVNEIGNAQHFTSQYNTYINKQYSVDIILSPYLIEGSTKQSEYPQIFIKPQINQAQNINKIILVLLVPCIDRSNACTITKIDFNTGAQSRSMKNELDDILAIVFYEFIKKIFGHANLSLISGDKYRWLPFDIGVNFTTPDNYITQSSTPNDKILFAEEQKIIFPENDIDRQQQEADRRQQEADRQQQQEVIRQQQEARIQHRQELIRQREAKRQKQIEKLPDSYKPEGRKASQIHIAADIDGYISQRLKEK